MKTAKLKKPADCFPIEKGYVTFEQAETLKALGYNRPAYGMYDIATKDNQGRDCEIWVLATDALPMNYNADQFQSPERNRRSLSAPTLAQVTEMLREKHIYITIRPFLNLKGIFFDFIIDSFDLDKLESRNATYPYDYKTYNHALSDAVTEALRLYSSK